MKRAFLAVGSALNLISGSAFAQVSEYINFPPALRGAAAPEGSGWTFLGTYFTPYTPGSPFVQPTAKLPAVYKALVPDGTLYVALMLTDHNFGSGKLSAQTWARFVHKESCQRLVAQYGAACLALPTTDYISLMTTISKQLNEIDLKVTQRQSEQDQLIKQLSAEVTALKADKKGQK